ncbi:hypothetical protein AJ80_01545 [Polytolypa hystricis UAMH7299]|uniref:Probable beta-glucosidase btgE n=1 Tax=Polytolypa hystricis (strain UAMH7299) TaxID=1447883 RepID=A0A2B7Z038_POLH7|nr:hypothetical protein AJ80_01545 [Polytolypa hystricis UAMH7299]
MKGALVLSTAAALVGSALGNGIHGRHAAHGAFHQRRGAAAPSGLYPEGSNPHATCGCTTSVVTWYGEATIVPEPVTQKTTTIESTSYTTLTISVTPSPEPEPEQEPEPEVPLPTQEVTVYPTPGTYTIPAKTVVVTKETTVCDATATDLSPGEHTIGGVTTVVETATTVTCPVATVKPSGETYVSVIETTTFVCPTPGTYTIAPITTSVSLSTVVVYPTPASYTPGTYTRDAETLTVVETDYVYVCPNPTGVLPTPEAPAPPQVTEVIPPPAKETKPAPPKKTPGKHGGGRNWGMTYTPYRADGQCKTKDEVLGDIEEIKGMGFSVIRVYGTDCDSLEHITPACEKHGLRMIIGIFIEADINDAQAQRDKIADWAKWEIVDLVVVGNEAITNGVMDAPTLAGFISGCRDKFAGKGYHGDITTAEPINVWLENGDALCPVIDILGANLHCFFNPDVTASQCGSFIKRQMNDLKSVCNKDVLNLETGWPTAGNANGKAIPGKAQQAEAMQSLIDEVGSNSVFFSLEDDTWKNPGPLGVEQYWGCKSFFQ